MGFSLAIEAAHRGAQVTLVTGPSNLTISHPNINRIDVESAEEMYQVCMQEAPMAEMVIMAAAVADYTCKQQSPVKLKKSQAAFVLELAPTRDILKELGARKTKDQILVGFALETDHEAENAQRKLVSKNLDFIVLNSLNDKGAGFGLETNKITIIDRSGTAHQGKLQNKAAVAAEILEFIVKNRILQP
jgi:phosphopantothenoylcysteine decarboxylase/phosphopantothenate--cysteine ligase